MPTSAYSSHCGRPLRDAGRPLRSLLAHARLALGTSAEKAEKDVAADCCVGTALAAGVPGAGKFARENRETCSNTCDFNARSTPIFDEDRNR